ncbi:hypothetical protein [Sorangium sp. So ce426]
MATRLGRPGAAAGVEVDAGELGAVRAGRGHVGRWWLVLRFRRRL